jgi:hypothetical protein
MTATELGTAHLSGEMRLLLACARKGVGSQLTEPVEGLFADEQFSWNRVLSKAVRHKMVSFLQRGLAERRELHGTPEFATLGSMTRRLAIFTLDRAERLKAIVTRFNDEGIPVVPYKGIALGQQLYGNIAARPAGDIDIVVRPKDARRARELILDMGYHLRYPIEDDAQEYRLENRYCEEFESEDEVQVELHWAFTNQDIRFTIDIDGLFERLDTIDVAGMPMKAFAREDLLLLLSVHGAKHHWSCLEFILQIAVLVRDTPEMNWEHVFQHAEQTGAYRKTLLALRLAHELLGAPMPAHVERLVYADKRVALVARQVPVLLEEPLQTDDDMGSSASDLFHLQLLDGVTDRIRYLYYRATTPSQPENWRVFRAGRYLIPGHAFIRPFQLVGRLIPATFAYMRSAREAKRTAAA